MSSFNPFDEKGIPVEKQAEDWKKLTPIPYVKDEIDPYTKTRIILMNGIEVEAALFAHQFHRNCADNDLRRELAMTRRIEQQQQKTINWLPPADESVLEVAIGYEQLAVDLTAWLAQNEPDAYVKQAMDFALLEDFDHLYRYADLLEMDKGIKAEKLVGGYTEIMPGRPTIAHHRHPFDSINRPIDSKTADIQTKLNTMIIVAGEQQTMNFYMNMGNRYPEDLGRSLFLEIGMVEEQHVTHYGGLLDPNCTWLENLLLHDYVEAYLYYSFYREEKNDVIKLLWEEQLQKEIGHLHKAAELLKKYEKKEWNEVVDGHFPKLLHLTSNKDYVRDVLKNQANLGKKGEDYVDSSELPKDYRFYDYQAMVNGDYVPSHELIKTYIDKNGEDYRYEDKESPVKALRDRKNDNTEVGRG